MVVVAVVVVSPVVFLDALADAAAALAAADAGCFFPPKLALAEALGGGFIPIPNLAGSPHTT